MTEQEQFALRGEAGNYISFLLTEVYGFPAKTSFLGGYEVRATADIKVGTFRAKADFATSTGEFYQLFQDLTSCNERLAGSVQYTSFERELEVTAQYDVFGNVGILGIFQPSSQSGTLLEFVMQSDQTFVKETLIQLEKLVNKYGGMQGI